MREVMPIMVGTAGHVDHGKTSLLQRLAGGAPEADRLPEERDRGLTIDIGYADMDLGDGRRIGVVDVPGHERFVRNMVAAASGIDYILLVVAADDGVMPQTREHLEIAELMGATAGAVVLTKVDLVDEDLAEAAEEEVRDLIASTFLFDASVHRVSSATGEGVEDLRRTLVAGVDAVIPREAEGIFRLPVQRSFMLPGHGTVVTGVPLAGRVKIGDVLEVVPGNHKCRVRAIQAYPPEVEEGRAGHRTALKLSDVSWREVSRGDVVAEPGFLVPSNLIEARFSFLSGRGRPITSNFPVRFHSGTAEVVGRLFLLGCREVRPGESALVQLRLDRPVVVAPGDRYVLRTPSPQVTLGGGCVIGASRKKISGSRGRIVRQVEKREASLADLRSAVLFQVGSAQLAPVSLPELSRALLRRREELTPVLDALAGAGDLEMVNDRYLDHRAAEDARRKLRACVDRFHQDEPLRPAADAIHLRERLGVTAPVLDVLVAATAEVEAMKGGWFRRVGFTPDLSAEQADLIDRLEELVLAGENTPPREKELPGLLCAGEREVAQLVDLLVGAKKLVRIATGMVMHRDRIDDACRRIREWIGENGGLAPADLKSILGMSRKYSIPFLEWLDAERITVRRGDRRELA